MHNKYMRLAVILFAAMLSSQAIANVKVPTILGDNMVLQRNQKVKIWGWADASEKVTVTLAGKTQSATADNGGNWLVEFPAQKANKKGQDIKIKGNNEIILSNVLFGDVWIGSGQSNMEWPLGRSQEGGAAINQSENQAIRLYKVPLKENGQPQKDISSNWRTSMPASFGGYGFSGVLYFFGHKINKEIDVPVGLIHSSWGGSPIEPWIPGGGKCNAMIAPMFNFGVKGFLWYQGESNVANGLGYYDKHKSLIEGWRKAWGNDKMPFYFVQLAPWANYKPGQLPATWEAQVKTLNLPYTGMAVTTDIVHNIGDIHPTNKKDVGERLARWALVYDYGKKIDYSGPLYKSHKVVGSKIAITFAHVGEGLESRNSQPLNEFQIAGEDGQYVAATAEIVGKTVVVSSDAVKEPKNVRFGWHKKANPNLMNKAKLPASPFHTDNWQGGTAERKMAKPKAAYREFTNKKGAKVSAKFLSVKYGKVYLVGETGKKMAVSLKSLSAADQEYVKEMAGE